MESWRALKMRAVRKTAIEAAASKAPRVTPIARPDPAIAGPEPSVPRTKAVSGANTRKTPIEPSKTPSATKTPEAAPVSPKAAPVSAKATTEASKAAMETAPEESTATAAAKAKRGGRRVHAQHKAERHGTEKGTKAAQRAFPGG